jgi:hypothetical protein
MHTSTYNCHGSTHKSTSFVKSSDSIDFGTQNPNNLSFFFTGGWMVACQQPLIAHTLILQYNHAIWKYPAN